MISILQAGTVTMLAVGTRAAAISAMKTDIPDLAFHPGQQAVGEALDGLVFHTVDRIRETSDVLKDELQFIDGRFQSAICQEYCDFGWPEYRTWPDGKVIHFPATAVCPGAPHTVVRFGTVDGDSLRFEGTWTTRRRYWKRQLNVAGAGTLATAPSDAAAG